MPAVGLNWTCHLLLLLNVFQTCPAQAIPIESEEREDGSRRTTRCAWGCPVHLGILHHLGYRGRKFHLQLFTAVMIFKYLVALHSTCTMHGQLQGYSRQHW
ncbi:unnamed protein product [Ostreobium quekettii]|uniref:Secreted protein n=1 Tax=Ostreobium quekettii TaxID=121088 RepID=A0A8S1J3G4_9CHLO|nr:unnamed protein product [Ostreobium quekettii]